MLHARFDEGPAAVKVFTLHLQDAARHERIDNVASFVGRDASGSFGIQAGHERFLTALDFGLARFRATAGDWQYLAAPGGLLYMRDGELHLCTRRYVRDADYRRISDTLARELRAEEDALRGLTQSLRQMEEEMFKKLWRLGREG